MHPWVRLQQNLITFVMVDNLGVEVPGLGAGFVLQLSKAGNPFAPSAGVKAEIGLGWYRYLSTVLEADTIGPVSIVVTGAGAVQQNLEYVIEHRVIYAVEFTYTLTDPLAVPIPGALVWMALDALVSNIIWSGVTDAFGVARDIDGGLPWLDPGTYYIRSQKPGYTFPVDTEVVT